MVRKGVFITGTGTDVGKTFVTALLVKKFRDSGIDAFYYKAALSETDLNNEWLLRLLKAFSMYSVNNASYISEANAELELGFDNLYKDESFHENDFEIIEPIFESYFAKLHSNIQEDNPSFKDIKLIRAKLLLKMQTLGIEKLINRNQELTSEYYA
jgi:hypothetical protein